jgi:hypothetical protein
MNQESHCSLPWYRYKVSNNKVLITEFLITKFQCSTISAYFLRSVTKNGMKKEYSHDFMEPKEIFFSSDFSRLKQSNPHLGPCTRIILLKGLHVWHRTIACNEYHKTACCVPYRVPFLQYYPI